jgi:hypothetical protein
MTIRPYALIATALALAMLLSSCRQVGTPDFVRFDRGERVTAEAFRSQSDRCDIHIWMGERSYGGRLRETGCTP